MLTNGLFLFPLSPVRDRNLHTATVQQLWPQTLLLQVHDLLLATPARKVRQRLVLENRQAFLQGLWPLGGGAWAGRAFT